MRAEIGSDFESVDAQWRIGPHRPPWEVPGDPITYVESGRQALRLVAQELGRRGHHRVAMPEHHCESMREPFLHEGWEIISLPVDQHLQVPPRVHLDLVGASSTVLLHAPYFGHVESDDELAALESLERSGIPVVVDETHRTTTPTQHPDRIRVASLRKLLPVPDGAYVTGLDMEAVTIGDPTGAAALREQAMRLKVRYLEGALAQSQHRPLFLEAEELTEATTRPTAMSGATAELIEVLDYPGMAAQRLANGRALAAALAGGAFELVVPVDGIVPSHVVLGGPAAPKLRVFLAQHQVFCPYHWPRPSDVRGAWRVDLVSVPVDHRYDTDDMTRVAALITGYRDSPDER